MFTSPRFTRTSWFSSPLKHVAIGTVMLTCASAHAAEPLNVAVAANLQYVFTELASAFTKSSGIEVKPSFGASGKFYTQITQGAPFQVFLSADMDFPQKLQEAGQTLDNPKPYALGSLVVWTTRDIKIENWQKLVNDPSVSHIAVANPQTAPYGREAIHALTTFKLADAAKPKLVYGDNIGQATQFIVTGAADFGFTAKSLVLAPDAKGKGKWVDVPASAYTPIEQGAALLKYAKDHDLASAQAFYKFLYSPTAKAIFEQNGYRAP